MDKLTDDRTESAYGQDPTVTLVGDGYDITPAAEMTTSGTNKFWFVVPVKLNSLATGGSCSATVKANVASADRTILNLGASSGLDNAPLSRSDRTYYFDNAQRYYKLNWDMEIMDDRLFANGAVVDLNMRYFLQYGLAADSWCLACLPSEFNYVDTSSTTQNGTKITDLVLD